MILIERKQTITYQQRIWYIVM